jgi:undecaprenyl-diphosphatase
VIAGAATGAAIGALTTRIWPTLPHRTEDVPPSADRRRLHADPSGAGVSVVVNPGSGSAGDGVVEAIRLRLPQARVVELEPDDDLPRALEAAASEADVLGIAGGDGSIAAAAEVAVERSLPLLALPSGTLNHLGRDLRVEQVDEALDALAAGEAVGVDLATVDGRLFVNSAGFGAYAEMLVNRERLEHRFGRWPGQLVAAVKTVLDAEPLALTINGEATRVWTAFVGNCRHEPSGLGPSWRPRLDDGRLDVRLLRADLPRSRARLALAMLSGRLARSVAYRELDVSELEIESPHARLRLALDGEVCDAPGGFVIRKLPQRLAVCAHHRAAD